MYIRKGGNPEHWWKDRDSRLAKTWTVCDLADEPWLELSMEGTSSSADRPFDAFRHPPPSNTSLGRTFAAAQIILYTHRVIFLFIQVYSTRQALLAEIQIFRALICSHFPSLGTSIPISMVFEQSVGWCGENMITVTIMCLFLL